MRIVVDTDPGMGSIGTDPEDGFAILYALASPGVVVEGITLTHGNVPVSHSWPNAKHLLDLAGRSDVEVHPGAHEPSDAARRGLQTRWLQQREGLTRLAPQLEVPESTAVDFLTATVARSPGEVTVVAIGPLTNIAAAIEADEQFATNLDRLVVMGGAATCPGNITPAAEFNVWMDPEAAAVVFTSGARITMVGLDVCHQTSFDTSQVDRLAERGSPLAEFAARCSRAWIDIRGAADDGAGSLHLYDSLAVAAAIEPDLLGCRELLVQVETGDGPAQGMTVTHTNDFLRMLLVGKDANADVALEVDVERFHTSFTELVTGNL